MASIDIELPNGWDPRGYQLDAWMALEAGVKRAILLWHRRAGKDSVCLNWTAAQTQLVTGVYWHMLPTNKQARKVLWDGIDRNGNRMMEQAFPKALRKSTNGTEMRIEMKAGSIWYACGSDNYDNLVGSNPVGVVFSEYPLANPDAWDYIRPILAENGGWALFPYTPRGRNHGYRLFNMAEKNPNWFAQKLTVDDTNSISQDAIQEDRDSGMPEERIEQEYWCSFDAALVGAYYGKQMKRAYSENRVGAVPWMPELPVFTSWDIGVGDDTSIIFYQKDGPWVNIIDHYKNNGVGADHYVNYLKEELPYTYGKHFLPHDVAVKEWGTGKTRIETLQTLGLEISRVPWAYLEDGHNAVRQLLPRCRFDQENATYLIDSLTNYQKVWDDERKIYLDKPLHDWSSHAASAMMYLALTFKQDAPEDFNRPLDAPMTFNDLIKAQEDREIGRNRI
jgi:phage terminase large subunit